MPANIKASKIVWDVKQLKEKFFGGSVNYINTETDIPSGDMKGDIKSGQCNFLGF